MRDNRALVGMVSGLAMFALTAHAQPAVEAPDYGSWPLHRRQFGSTGGGRVVIGDHDPIVQGGMCSTDFTAALANGTVQRHRAEFDAVPSQGGVLCTNGRWRSLQGEARGTTPYQVFFRDGVAWGWPQ